MRLLLNIPPLGEMSFAELLKALAGEVAEADATMQLRQRLAWREATRGESAVIEGLDRLGNLALLEARFSFQLEAATRPWYARLWAVLVEPPGPGWLRRAAARLAPGPARFRLAKAGRRGGARTFLVTVAVGRAEDGSWQSILDGLPPGAAPPETPLPRLN